MLDITNRVRAACPAIAVESFEPNRFAQQLHEKFPKRTVLMIDARGLVRDFVTGAIYEMTAEVTELGKKVLRPVTGYSAAFNFLCDKKETFLIVLDFQHNVANAAAYRPLLSAMPNFKKAQVMVILIAPAWKMPPELQHEIKVLQDPLPKAEEFESTLVAIEESASRKVEKKDRPAWLNAGRGLTVDEFEEAAALAAIGGFKHEIIQTEKMRLINSSRAMTWEKTVKADQLGGLSLFKEFLTTEVLPSITDPQLRVKAIMEDGPTGTGKSLGSRVLAGMLDIPLIGFDLSACKGSYVGESENNLKAGLKMLEAIAPAAVRFDEIEKALGDSAASAKTGNVTMAMEGILLTFMQDSEAPILFVGTTNNSQLLSDPMRQRFDAHFYFDLPGSIERQEIAAIHLGQYGVELDGLPAFISEETPDWTGREIANLIRSAARRTMRKVTKDAIIISKESIHPISQDPHSNMADLRDWGKKHLRPANSPEPVASQKAGRKLS